MIKKDLEPNTNRDNPPKREEASEKQTIEKRNEKEEGRTKVKNANAAGLGTIGRNDRRLDRVDEEENRY